MVLARSTWPDATVPAQARRGEFPAGLGLTLLNRSDLRDHRKIPVFDDERVFAGGKNLAD
jgi:phosphatidylserine/phosphatidylglycerophosphate/cardiolipin synthase-like enzyme